MKDAKEKSLNKPAKGHLAAANVLKKHLKEFRVNKNAAEYTVGQEIKADILKQVQNRCYWKNPKGKGFQGLIKRHGQSRGPETHGSRYHRRPNVQWELVLIQVQFSNKKLAGHMSVTIQNLDLVRVDAEKNLMLVKGAYTRS